MYGHLLSFHPLMLLTSMVLIAISPVAIHRRYFYDREKSMLVGLTGLMLALAWSEDSNLVRFTVVGMSPTLLIVLLVEMARPLGWCLGMLIGLLIRESLYHAARSTGSALGHMIGSGLAQGLERSVHNLIGRRSPDDV
ncbi:hypothetical protein H6758_05265 [Candidatus Nomurabacteria bacterium]|nr:hypothetical protein [Candidatus Nomurabacteria bacterium]